MLANVGRIDRALRVVLGILLVALAHAGTGMGWGWIGIVPLLSGLLRHCPFYAKLGISTCSGS